jgi:hypothetical protein
MKESSSIAALAASVGVRYRLSRWLLQEAESKWSGRDSTLDRAAISKDFLDFIVLLRPRWSPPKATRKDWTTWFRLSQRQGLVKALRRRRT